MDQSSAHDTNSPKITSTISSHVQAALATDQQSFDQSMRATIDEINHVYKIVGDIMAQTPEERLQNNTFQLLVKNIITRNSSDGEEYSKTEAVNIVVQAASDMRNYVRNFERKLTEEMRLREEFLRTGNQIHNQELRKAIHEQSDLRDAIHLQTIWFLDTLQAEPAESVELPITKEFPSQSSQTTAINNPSIINDQTVTDELIKIHDEIKDEVREPQPTAVSEGFLPNNPPDTLLNQAALMHQSSPIIDTNVVPPTKVVSTPSIQETPNTGVEENTPKPDGETDKIIDESGSVQANDYVNTDEPKIQSTPVKEAVSSDTQSEVGDESSVRPRRRNRDVADLADMLFGQAPKPREEAREEREEDSQKEQLIDSTPPVTQIKEPVHEKSVETSDTTQTPPVIPEKTEPVAQPTPSVPKHFAVGPDGKPIMLKDLQHRPGASSLLTTRRVMQYSVPSTRVTTQPHQEVPTVNTVQSLSNSVVNEFHYDIPERMKNIFADIDVNPGDYFGTELLRRLITFGMQPMIAQQVMVAFSTGLTKMNPTKYAPSSDGKHISLVEELKRYPEVTKVLNEYLDVTTLDEFKRIDAKFNAILNDRF